MKYRLRSLLPVAGLLLFAGAAHASPLKAGELRIYKSFDSDRDIKVELLALGPTSTTHYLMRITGAKGQPKAVVHRYRKERTRAGARFVMAGTKSIHLMHAGKRTLYKGTWHQYSELSWSGERTRVVYDKGASRATNGGALVNAYRRQQGVHVSRRDAIEKALQDVREQIRKACGNRSFRIEVKWTAFISAKAPNLPHAAINYLKPLVALCKGDKDYRARIRQLGVARINPAKTRDAHQLRLTKSAFFVALAAQQPNNAYLAKAWLRENL